MNSLYKICLVLVASTGFLKAQNLVPNPSFENGYETCDHTSVINPDNFESSVLYWSSPTDGTADVFSTKVDKSCYAFMPDNTWHSEYGRSVGQQSPRSGNRFAGIFSYSANKMPSWRSSYREYIQVKLNNPLIPGEQYCVEFFASLAEGVRYASNNLGIYFSDRIWRKNVDWDWYYRKEGFTLPFTPQIVSDSILTDSLNWFRISSVYTATFPAEYLIIGNFSEDNETRAIDVKMKEEPSLNSYEYAYYFIDDVSVEQIQPKSFVLGGTTQVCEGDSTTLTATSTMDEVIWTTKEDTTKVLATGPVLKVRPTIKSTYRVKGRNCNAFVKDTISVTVLPRKQVYLGEDTTICQGAFITLKPEINYASYKWQDQSSSTFFNTNNAGIYSVEVQTQQGCTSKDEILISIKNPPTVNLGNDTLLCEGFFPIKPNYVEDDWTFQWSDGSQDFSMLPNKAGQYWMKAKNRCGEDTDFINVFSYDNLTIPNIVTLNEDNLNERLEIKGIGPEVTGRLTIFNRWGKTIYTNSRYQGDWPLNDTMLSSGVYYYQFEYPGCKAYKSWLHVIK